MGTGTGEVLGIYFGLFWEGEMAGVLNLLHAKSHCFKPLYDNTFEKLFLFSFLLVFV
jgi:hypothetical protein